MRQKPDPRLFQIYRAIKPFTKIAEIFGYGNTGIKTQLPSSEVYR